MFLKFTYLLTSFMVSTILFDLISILDCGPVSTGHALIGFAMYYFTYDPWIGKLLYLEDFYVMKEYRGMCGISWSCKKLYYASDLRLWGFIQKLSIYIKVKRH